MGVVGSDDTNTTRARGGVLTAQERDQAQDILCLCTIITKRNMIWMDITEHSVSQIGIRNIIRGNMQAMS